jgi:GT2 family glycosyltransferase
MKRNIVKKSANTTVAIATLNRPAGLLRCIEAVMAGESLPAELIVVDQSDRDDSEQLLRPWQWPQTQLQYLRQPKRGLSASRNAALAAARAPVIAMTDDDCAPAPGWLRAVERAFAEDPEPTAVTGRILPLGPEAPGLFAVSSRPSTIPAQYSGKAPPWQAASGGNFSVRREWWERLGGFDERLGAGSRGQASEDIDFAYRLLRCRRLILYEPDALVYHERQPLARRIETRWTYGYGIGAFCGKWMRRRDAYALRLLATWLGWRGREFGGALIRGRWYDARERRLMLRGTAAGVIYGLKIGGAGP